jgi:hypothetical protein
MYCVRASPMWLPLRTFMVGYEALKPHLYKKIAIQHFQRKATSPSHMQYQLQAFLVIVSHWKLYSHIRGRMADQRPSCVWHARFVVPSGVVYGTFQLKPRQSLYHDVLSKQIGPCPASWPLASFPDNRFTLKTLFTHKGKDGWSKAFLRVTRQVCCALWGRIRYLSANTSAVALSWRSEQTNRPLSCKLAGPSVHKQGCQIPKREKNRQDATSKFVPTWTKDRSIEARSALSSDVVYIYMYAQWMQKMKHQQEMATISEVSWWPTLLTYASVGQWQLWMGSRSKVCPLDMFANCAFLYRWDASYDLFFWSHRLQMDTECAGNIDRESPTTQVAMASLNGIPYTRLWFGFMRK